MTRRYTRTAPDPELAARNQEFVRTRYRREFPLQAFVVDSIVSADMPLEDAARDLARVRARRQAARTSRSAR